MDIHHLKDLELLRLIRAGDKQAFNELYNRYWDKLLIITYKITRNQQTAEDLVQETFIKIWTLRDKLEIKHPESYLVTACKYITLNHIAKEKRNPVVPGDLPVLATDEFSDELYETKILQEKLRQEINLLPAQCQLIFRYSRDMGLTIRQISEKLDLSPRTVEGQITKALARLRKSMKIIQLCFFNFF
jgi:RNA polymerase sigma-70 factor (ECF subfamily)